MKTNRIIPASLEVQWRSGPKFYDEMDETGRFREQDDALIELTDNERIDTNL